MGKASSNSVRLKTAADADDDLGKLALHCVYLKVFVIFDKSLSRTTFSSVLCNLRQGTEELRSRAVHAIILFCIVRLGS